MNPNAEIRRGDIVSVWFDFHSENEMKFVQPAVVLQNDVGNQHANTTLVAPVTESSHDYPFEVSIEGSESLFETEGGIRLDQIRVVSIEQQIHSIEDSVDADTLADIDTALKISLGIE